MLDTILAFAAAKWPALAVLAAGLPIAFNQHIRQYVPALWAKVTSRSPAASPDLLGAVSHIQGLKLYFESVKCPKGVEKANELGKCLFEHGGQG